MAFFLSVSRHHHHLYRTTSTAAAPLVALRRLSSSYDIPRKGWNCFQGSGKNTSKCSSLVSLSSSSPFSFGFSRRQSMSTATTTTTTTAGSSSSSQSGGWSGQNVADPSQRYLSKERNPMSSIFQPSSVAIIGATERVGSVGRTLMQNMLEGRKNNNQYDHPLIKVFPVNPTRESILGVSCYKSLSAIPEPVDLVVVVTPAKTVPGVMREAVDKKVEACVIISAGFKELGEAGKEAEQQVLDIARKGNIRLVGPNCLGVMNPLYGLNATFAASMALPGNLAFISQSGAMCTAVLDWSLREKIGFSSFVSIGSMADVGWGDLIEYLGSDPNTSAILMYMESIGDARAFLSAAKEVALSKPIIVIKAGKTQAAAQAAASHTGSMAGAYDTFEAAMKRVGVMTVDTIGELFECALVLGKQPRPRGPRLLLVTNAGGPGVLATDATVVGGAEMAEVDSSTIEKLNKVLPEAWSHSNPVDILGDAGPERFAKTLEIVMKDKNSDGVLVILSPQDVTDATETAKLLVPFAQNSATNTKPILASWMGGNEVAEGAKILNQGGIPTFEYPDAAASTFARIWKQTKDLEMMYEIPEQEVVPFQEQQQKVRATEILKKAKSENRSLLTETESKQVLDSYGLPIVETRVTRSAKEAQEIAEKMGYPVVLKLNSNTITHKKDVGGVKLNLYNKEDVVEAYESILKSVTEMYGSEHFEGVSVQPMVDLENGIELILGSSVDPQFGPLVVFGAGGTYVEIFKDRSLGIPPLNGKMAEKLIMDTKVSKALKGGMGKRFEGVDLKALEATLVKFSQMVVDLSEYIAECDINPLLASKSRSVCLDARIVLNKEGASAPSLAIRPYPSEYVSKGKLKDGTQISFRPIHPGDEPRLQKFHECLSKEAVRNRYLSDVSLEERTARQFLIGVCCADYDRMIALIVLNDETQEMIGISRVQRYHNNRDMAELKLIIRDEYHRKNLGNELMKRLVDVAKRDKLKRLRAVVLNENIGMIALLQKYQFRLSNMTDNPDLIEGLLDIQ